MWSILINIIPGLSGARMRRRFVCIASCALYSNSLCLYWSSLLSQPSPAVFTKNKGTLSGNLFYRDSSWFIINGRTLYKLNVDAFRTVANGNWTDAA
ncbi:MAG: hypothetical protein V4685_04745, partial [Bacteroidota bacterium]